MRAFAVIATAVALGLGGPGATSPLELESADAAVIHCPNDGSPRNGRCDGTGGSDVIFGTAGDNRIYGYAGLDEIHAAGGRDVVRGGRGRDLIFGGQGIDRLFGNNGPDFLLGGRGFDYVWGGNGSDTIRVERDGSADVFSGDYPGKFYGDDDLCVYDLSPHDFNNGGCERKFVV